MGIDNRPSRPSSLWDAVTRKIDQFLTGGTGDVPRSSQYNTIQSALGEPTDVATIDKLSAPLSGRVDKHIVIDGVQVGTPAEKRGLINFGEETDLLGVDHESQRQPTIDWIDLELDKAVNRSDVDIEEGSKSKTMVLNPKNELKQTWGEQVNNAQTCMLASIQMAMSHAGWIESSNQSFDFVMHKMQILELARRIDPALIDQDRSRSLVIEPSKREQYLKLFSVLEQSTQSLHSPDGAGTLDLVGGYDWGTSELGNMERGLPENFINTVQGDSFIGRAAMILKMANSFLTNKGEVFSLDIHAENTAGGDNGHNVVIGGMRISKIDNRNQVEFWVVDPLKKDRGVGYWEKPETFLNSSCMFVATSAGQREAWVSEE